MKTITGALAALLLFAGQALAANAEGTIKSIDRASLTLTLDDGEKFKLSEEFNFEDYSVGMDVTIQYDEIKGQKIVLQIIQD